MNTREFFLIAEIKSTVNTEGYLRLSSISDFSERFSTLDFVFIDVFGDKRKFFVEGFYFSGKHPVIKFKNFDSIEDVEFLIDKKIFVDRENLAETGENEFIVNDLIGADVYYGVEFFGKLKEIESYPGNDVFVVEKPDGNEILVPSVKEFIEQVDLENKRIYLNPGKDLNYDEV